MIKCCRYCNSDFNSSHNSQIYCCRKCANRANHTNTIIIEHADMIELIVKSGHSILIDKEDLPLVKEYSWHVSKDSKSINNYYARTKINGKYLALHRFIMNPEPNMAIDHINHNGLDCRKINLRICSNTHNIKNRLKPNMNCSSIYKGVSNIKNTDKWIAYITHEGNRIYLGYFACEIEAARAYNEAAKQYFGEFAYLNKT